MKSLLASLLCLSALALSSCDKIENALSTDITLTPNSATFTINPTAVADTAVTLKEIQSLVNVDSLIKAETPEFSSANIKAIKVKSFKVEFLNSDSENNIGNLQSLSSLLGASGKSALQIFAVDSNPADVKSSIEISSGLQASDVKEYVTSGNLKYTLKGKLRKAITKALQTKVTVSYVCTVGLK